MEKWASKSSERKHNERYLHANSHHRPKEKYGIIKTLTTRAIIISDSEYLNQELNQLLQVFE